MLLPLLLLGLGLAGVGVVVAARAAEPVAGPPVPVGRPGAPPPSLTIAGRPVAAPIVREERPFELALGDPLRPRVAEGAPALTPAELQARREQRERAIGFLGRPFVEGVERVITGVITAPLQAVPVLGGWLSEKAAQALEAQQVALREPVVPAPAPAPPALTIAPATRPASPSPGGGLSVSEAMILLSV